MNNDKLLRAFIEASGFYIETTEDIKRYYKCDDVMDNGEPKENAMPESIIKTVDYKVTKKVDEERFTFTRYMIKDLIDVLGNHTVARNGHNNDDVLAIISKLEAMIDENI